MQKPKLVIVTGLSGSGLSTAIHALQDDGFYCVDNLPIELLWDTIELIESGQIIADKGYAFGMDIRNHHFADRFPKIKDEISNRVDLDVIFIRADLGVLEQRFGTSRRRHPLALNSPTLGRQIAQEDILLTPVQSAADSVIDTTHFKPKDLRRALEVRMQQKGLPSRTLQVVLISFGFKHPSVWPVESLHDVRFLPNPYFEEHLREKSGLDDDVQEFVFRQKDAFETLQKLEDYYRFLLPRYLDEGRHFLRIGIGCTGGRHRSVAFVEKLALAFSERPILGMSVSAIHRDISKFS